jgi:hypothetical protein
MPQHNMDSGFPANSGKFRQIPANSGKFRSGIPEYSGRNSGAPEFLLKSCKSWKKHQIPANSGPSPESRNSWQE